MKQLIDSDKFLKEIYKFYTSNEDYNISSLFLERLLSKHTIAMVDEPHHPSGMDRDKINTRNELRGELRNDSF